MSKYVIKNGHFFFKDGRSNGVDGTHGNAPVGIK
jgi:hypothetical protein